MFDRFAASFYWDRTQKFTRPLTYSKHRNIRALFALMQRPVDQKIISSLFIFSKYTVKMKLNESSVCWLTKLNSTHTRLIHTWANKIDMIGCRVSEEQYAWKYLSYAVDRILNISSIRHTFALCIRRKSKFNVNIEKSLIDVCDHATKKSNYTLNYNRTME